MGFANLRWYNSVFIGLAPLLALAVAMLLAPSPVAWSPGMEDCKHWAVAAPILVMCLPSATDWKLAMQSWPILCAALALLGWHLFKL
ncbi:MAG: hypothetical protein HXX19_13430 [Rhodoferax sp.]|nr:hypothetical protein [Rhodoferax sp.]